MIAQSHADEAARRNQALSSRTAGAQAKAEAEASEGWAAYMQRQVTERTERLGLMGERMDNLEDHSSGWAEDVNKFVSRQKKNFIMGAVKGKLGL